MIVTIQIISDDNAPEDNIAMHDSHLEDYM
jgi:hypothetical protein